MLKTVDLEQTGRNIIKANGNAGLLDTILIDLSGWYAYYSEQFIRLEHQEAVFYQENEYKEDGEKMTVKGVEMLWKISEEGQQHTRVKQTIKTTEKLMSNIKASIRRAEIEARI